MYGEPFGVPEPLETVFVSWFQGGEVFRSGLTYRRGAGNVFYFRPGHETYPTYHDENVKLALSNAVKWAFNPMPRIQNVGDAPNVPVEAAPEKIEERGPNFTPTADKVCNLSATKPPTTVASGPVKVNKPPTSSGMPPTVSPEKKPYLANGAGPGNIDQATVLSGPIEVPPPICDGQTGQIDLINCAAK